MWRNSVSFSSKLINSNKSLFNPSGCSGANDVVRPLLHCRSEFHPYSSSPPSSSDYLKLGFQPSDGLPALSATAVDLASLASKSAQLTRHYGRCYWELSKARLSMLVVATSGTGFVLGSGSAVDFAGLCCTCAGTMMVAASANSLNQNQLLTNQRLHPVSSAVNVAAIFTAVLPKHRFAPNAHLPSPLPSSTNTSPTELTLSSLRVPSSPHTASSPRSPPSYPAWSLLGRRLLPKFVRLCPSKDLPADLLTMPLHKSRHLLFSGKLVRPGPPSLRGAVKDYQSLPSITPRISSSLSTATLSVS